jgi:hypothetical protein
MAPFGRCVGTVSRNLGFNLKLTLMCRYTKAFQLGQTNRSEIAQNALLPFLKRAEQSQECLAAHPAIVSRQKDILFNWLDLLSEELRGIPANRGTCLDGVAAILERSAFSINLAVFSSFH